MEEEDIQAWGEGEEKEKACRHAALQRGRRIDDGMPCRHVCCQLLPVHGERYSANGKGSGKRKWHA